MGSSARHRAQLRVGVGASQNALKEHRASRSGCRSQAISVSGTTQASLTNIIREPSVNDTNAWARAPREVLHLQCVLFSKNHIAHVAILRRAANPFYWNAASPQRAMEIRPTDLGTKLRPEGGAHRRRVAGWACAGAPHRNRIMTYIGSSATATGVAPRLFESSLAATDCAREAWEQAFVEANVAT
jgi:hypothetical protein